MNVEIDILNCQGREGMLVDLLCFVSNLSVFIVVGFSGAIDKKDFFSFNSSDTVFTSSEGS